MLDKYQIRYTAHQLRKKETLKKLMRKRHSTRIFAEREIEEKKLSDIIDSLGVCPSSCDRHGIYTKVIRDRDEKALLGGLLVGGVGWMHRSPIIVLLFADSLAYKEKLLYMSYLDAGVVLYHIFLMAEAEGMKACYVNPQVRNEHLLYFQDSFGQDKFCGAMCLGYEEK